MVMQPDLKAEFAKIVFPGYGFFGAKPETKLRLPVDDVVDSLEISIQSGKKSYLNILDVEIFDKSGKKLSLPDICESARLSTSLDDNKSLDAIPVFKSKRLIHTALERRPRLEVFFKKPVAISRIDIVNRPGVLGARTRYIVVSAWKGENEVLHYKNAGDSLLLTKLKSFEDRLGVKIDKELRGLNEVYVEANAFRERIAEAVISGEIECTAFELMALLPVYDEDPIVGNATLIFMGVLTAKFTLQSKSLHTKAFIEFKGIMSSPQRISAMEVYATKYLKIQETDYPDLVIGKHKIGFSGILADKDEYKKVIHIVQKQLAEWNHESLICYGTLLGAVRDKQFIPHDDDVDMLYFDKSKSQEEMMQDRLVVLQKFKGAGYKIWDSGTNFHVTPKGYSVGIDLFPCFTKGKKTSLMMQKYLYRMIPTSLLKPIGSIELYGEIYPAPNKPEEFLEERYGKTWPVSDPYYEWPWPLNNPKDWPRRAKTRDLVAKRTLVVGWGQHIGPGGKSPPKNSKSLIETGVKQKFDAIEVDTRLSKDNVFVLGHDDIIHGENGKKIKISDHTAKQLSKFSLGKHKSKDNTIISLKTSLKTIDNKLVMLDPRTNVSNYKALRKTVDSSGYDAGKILFCGYGDDGVKALIEHFPESVILYKYYGSQASIDDYVLDELVEKQVDGLMLFWPMHYEDFAPFMKRLKARNLQILFYVHGSWPSRGEVDNSDESLKRMIEAGVDYVTTTASNAPSFKKLVKQSY